MLLPMPSAPTPFSTLRLEIAVIDAEIDQVRAALRMRDAEIATLRERVRRHTKRRSRSSWTSSSSTPPTGATRSATGR